MSHPYDAIVIGAGHNGLTCACYLARAGLRGRLNDCGVWQQSGGHCN